jgi:hypothetical protein
MSNVVIVNLCYLSYNYHSIIRTTSRQVCMYVSVILKDFLYSSICTYCCMVSASPFILVSIILSRYIYIETCIFFRGRKLVSQLGTCHSSNFEKDFYIIYFGLFLFGIYVNEWKRTTRGIDYLFLDITTYIYFHYMR